MTTAAPRVRVPLSKGLCHVGAGEAGQRIGQRAKEQVTPPTVGTERSATEDQAQRDRRRGENQALRVGTGGTPSARVPSRMLAVCAERAHLRFP